MSDFVNQEYEIEQLVLPSNLNNLYQNKDQMLTAYFNYTPLICNGVDITQTSTSNVFSFTSGCVRFEDQDNIISDGTVQATYAYLPTTTSLTISVAGTGSSPQYYIVIMLTQTAIDTNNVTMTASISSTAMTLAQISSSANPDAYIPLRTITTSDHSVYTIGYDTNCVATNAMNYLISKNGTSYLIEPLNVTSSITSAGNITSTTGSIDTHDGSIGATQYGLNTNLSYATTLPLYAIDSTNSRRMLLWTTNLFDTASTYDGGGIQITNSDGSQASSLSLNPTTSRPWYYNNVNGINSGVALVNDFTENHYSLSNGGSIDIIKYFDGTYYRCTVTGIVAGTQISSLVTGSINFSDIGLIVSRIGVNSYGTANFDPQSGIQGYAGSALVSAGGSTIRVQCATSNTVSGYTLMTFSIVFSST